MTQISFILIVDLPVDRTPEEVQRAQEIVTGALARASVQTTDPHSQSVLAAMASAFPKAKSIF
jgi:hypothetical protein